MWRKNVKNVGKCGGLFLGDNNRNLSRKQITAITPTQPSAFGVASYADVLKARHAWGGKIA